MSAPAWRDQNPLATTEDATSAPDATPFDLPVYQPPAQTTSVRLAERAESEFPRADQASGNANRFVLMSIVFALSLTLRVGGVIRSVLLPLA